jgi:thioredoxin-related protein
MPHPLRRSLVVAAFAAMVVLAAGARPALAVDWKHWNEGLAAAGRTGRPVIVDVYTDWCGWCRRMDNEVYARPEVSEYLEKHFVTIRLNAESNEPTTWQGTTRTAKALAAKFDVSGYPTTIFLTSEGEHLANAPGYIKADRFMLLLRFVGDGHMARHESWDDFMKQEQGGHSAP